MSDQQDRHQHSITLAQHFYDDHKTLFDDAVTKNALDEQCFEVPLTEFDRWLVTQGVLDQPADAFASNSVQRYGVVQHRNAARVRLNHAARKATEHPAYSTSIRTATGMLIVKLLELYARDTPADIAGGFRVSTEHYMRQVARIVKLVDTSPAVSDMVRQRVRLCATVMEPLLKAFSWAGLNMQTEIKQQDEGRALGLPGGIRPRRRIKAP